MSGETVVASGYRQNFSVITSYTLLLLVCSVAAGFILGIVRRLLGDSTEHQWGTWDSALVLRTVGTFVVCFAVYWLLARNHPHRFVARGISIGALTGETSFLLSLINAPTIQPMLLAFSVASHVVIFLVVAAILRVLFHMPAISAGENIHELQRQAQHL